MQGQAEAALAAYASILERRPELHRARHGFALALKLTGALREAEQILEQTAHALQDFEVLRNHGVVCLELGEYPKAVASLSRALELREDDGGTSGLLGEALLGIGALEKALAAGARCAELEPDNPKGWYVVATASARACDETRRETAAAELFRTLEAKLQESPRAPKVSAFGTLMLGAPLAIQKELVARQASQSALRRLPPPDGPRADGRLRVGYLSADLWDHAAGFLAAPLFEAHDRDRIEVHAFSLRTVDDDTQHRIRAAVDGFHNCEHAPDEAIALAIRNLGIDVLVDMNGPTQGARMGVLGRRPAPVQLHWLGYPGTVGRGLADANITHPVRDPRPFDRYYDEPLIRIQSWLGTGGWPLPDLPSRAAYGLPPDATVLGYFSASYRIDARLLDAWAQILEGAEKAILWLPEYTEFTRTHLVRAFEKRAVDPGRLYFTPFARLSTDWRHRHADVWLDAFSPSGGTAGVLAAWAGVPVLTLAGKRPQDRTGAVMATLAGVPELVAETPGEYVRSALRLCRDAAARARLKERLQSQRNLLFSPTKAARELEAVYAASLRRFVPKTGRRRRR